jgi:hypothetical protein
MHLCNKNLTPLQRRSMQKMSAAMVLTILTNFSTPGMPNPFIDVFPNLTRLLAHPEHSPVLAGLFAVLSVLPVLGAVWVTAKYLKAEPDEFIRALVVRALLWGFAVAMTGNAIASVYMNLYSRAFPLTVLNADLFFIAGMVSFRLMQRSYR